MRAARRIEEDSLGPRVEERAGPSDDDGRIVPSGHADRLPCRPPGRGEILGRLVAAELDRVGIELGDDLRDPLPVGIRGDRDDPRRRRR